MSQPAFDFGEPASDVPAAEPEITYTVGELATAINRTLRHGLGEGVWVRGEIQGWSDRNKHAYFTLADGNGGDPAVINVQFFANSRARLRPLLERHRLHLADGIAVRIFGHLDFWAPGGRLGLKMTGIDPRFTLGELALARDEVVRRLVASGLFDANRSRPLSPVPLRVGVVASVGSAAWHDFRHELERSGFGFRLVVADTRVQGDGAAQLVAGSITSLAHRSDVDVVAVIRGGGARNELATFDAESIALAIASSPVPIITGLGHEVDRSVADEVAHTALKTPTACATALCERVRTYAVAAETSWAAIESLSARHLDESLGRLTDRAHRVARRTHSAVERADGRLASRIDALRHRAPRSLRSTDERLDRAGERLVGLPNRLLDAEERHLAGLDARVAAHDPAVLLARGWTITLDEHRRAVRSVADAPPGTRLSTRVADGTITSRVEESPS